MSKYRYGKKRNRDVGRIGSYVKMDPESASAFVKKLIKTPRPKNYSLGVVRKVDVDDGIGVAEGLVSDLRDSLSELQSTLAEIESLSIIVRDQIGFIEDSVEELESLM